MKQEKQQEVALMRYGAIAPIIAGLDERYPSKTAFFAEISAKGLMGPDGTAADSKQGYAPLRTPPYQRSLVSGIAVSVPVLRCLMAKTRIYIIALSTMPAGSLPGSMCSTMITLST